MLYSFFTWISIFICSLLLVVAFTSSLLNLSSIKSLSISLFLISTSFMGVVGFITAFKKLINIGLFFSVPNIFLNTKSICGFNNVLYTIFITPYLELSIVSTYMILYLH
uniref:Uncharacterized protein n=1 Tax=Clostridium perfringens TaxID=1502 RepID=Q2L5J4_CLOPF|nr:conserved hypothetical protein [Clostridium perfringens]